MTSNIDLPEPDTCSSEVSARLERRLIDLIEQAGEGGIGFQTFMKMALYEPGHGYYSAGSRKFGAGGDFVTAPEISALFARAMARQSAQILADSEAGCILEFGAGSGALAAGIIETLAQTGECPEQYLIMEPSPDLRQRQKEALAERIPEYVDRVVWLDRLPERPLHGVIIANEVLDAMPVHRVIRQEGIWREICVRYEAGLAFDVRSIEDASLLAAVSRIDDISPNLPDGYVTEVNLAAVDWIGALDGVLGRGVALVVDYGYPAREYFLPERCQGTLRCYFRHRAHDNPLINVGLQDITAHLDFTALAEAADQSGMSVLGYTTQAAFLLGSGILEENPGSDPLSQVSMAQQLRSLLMPGGMGESFKVLGLGRHFDSEIAGFSFSDQRFRL